MHVRPLTLDDVADYLRLIKVTNGESGRHGLGHSHAYSVNEPYDHAGAHDREVVRWSTALDDMGWRRAWGLFDDDLLVGQIHFVGGTITTELHRVSMGMGIARSHHQRGGGTLLLTTGLAWATEDPAIDWIDLGVFDDNDVAKNLYLSYGFEVMGYTPDRYRVDGVTLGEGCHEPERGRSLLASS